MSIPTDITEVIVPMPRREAQYALDVIDRLEEIDAAGADVPLDLQEDLEQIVRNLAMRVADVVST